MRSGWVLVASAAAMVASEGLGDVVREGSGARRDTLNSMELKASPASWTDLGEWIGDPVTQGSVAGKPVLIVTWASWYPTSVQALSQVQRIADANASKGLVVIGVHHQQGWDSAAKAVSSRNITFPIAHDSEGKFRDALNVDNDPDFYVIDRAGQLRFADIAAGSIEEAVKTVVGEDEAHAGNVQALIAERAAEARRQQNTLTSINTDLNDLASIPELPFGDPTEDDYKNAKLPELTDEMRDLVGQRVNSNRGEKPPPIKVSLPGSPEWLGGAPNMKGRALVLYFWHPELRFTYWPMMQNMDLLQRKHSRDIVVVGVMTGIGNLESRNRRDREESAEDFRKAWDRFTASREFDHKLLYDFEAEVLGSINSGGRGRNTVPIPGVLVVSTDNTLRWIGVTHGREYEAALDSVLAKDPAITARRKAEREYIENKR
jgi:hypothetical protein